MDVRQVEAAQQGDAAVTDDVTTATDGRQDAELLLAIEETRLQKMRRHERLWMARRPQAARFLFFAAMRGK